MAEALKPTAIKKTGKFYTSSQEGGGNQKPAREGQTKRLKKERRPKRTIRKIKRTSNNNCQTTSANTKTWDGSESTIGVTHRRRYLEIKREKKGDLKHASKNCLS